jgi:hypothetical protein
LAPRRSRVKGRELLLMRVIILVMGFGECIKRPQPQPNEPPASLHLSKLPLIQMHSPKPITKINAFGLRVVLKDAKMQGVHWVGVGVFCVLAWKL